MLSLYQLTRRSYQAPSFCTALHFCLQLTEWHKRSHTVLNPLFWIYIIILLFWHPIIWRRLVSPRLYQTRREEMWWTRTGFKHRALHGTSLQYNALITPAINHFQIQLPQPVNVFIPWRHPGPWSPVPNLGTGQILDIKCNRRKKIKQVFHNTVKIWYRSTWYA